MSFPGGLLKSGNVMLMGESFVLDPGVSVGGEAALHVTEFSKNFFLSGPLTDMQITSVTCSTFPVTSYATEPHLHDEVQSSMQMTLQFTSGSSMFGQQQEFVAPPTALSIGNIVTYLSPRIIVNCTGSIVSLTAASSVKIGFRHIGKRVGVWPAGIHFGPAMRMNIGYSYGTPKSVQNWYSDVPQLHNLIAAVPVGGIYSSTWARPQFAEALTLALAFRKDELDPVTLITGTTGNIVLTFFDAFANVVRIVSYPAPFHSFPLTLWPPDAFYVMVDTTGVGAATWGAGTKLQISPIHAINL